MDSGIRREGDDVSTPKTGPRSPSPTSRASTAGQVRVKAWVVSGNEKTSGEKLTIGYCGSAEQKNYITHLAFDGACRDESMGELWLWQVREAFTAAGDGCSLMVVCSRVPVPISILGQDSFTVPSWLEWEVSLPLSPSAIVKSDLGRDLKRMRRNGLSYELAKDPADIRLFYWHMYLPHARRTHGSRAMVLPFEYIEERWRDCELLFVLSDRNRVGGMLIRRDDHGPRLWKLGVRNGERVYTEMGVGTALYWYSLQHLEKKGHRRANIGGSRAFITDGGYRYKRKWGQRLIGGSDTCFRIVLLANTGGARAFLARNPFIFREGNDLKCAVFPDSKPPADGPKLEGLRAGLRAIGVFEVSAYRLCEGREGLRAWE